MKVRNLHLKNHSFFGTIDTDFTDQNGKTLDTVVIGGINGSGKTSMLEVLFSNLSGRNDSHAFLELDISGINNMTKRFDSGETAGRDIIKGTEFRKLTDEFVKKSSDNDKDKLPKIIYMPTEINFSELESDIKLCSYKYTPTYEISGSLTKNIPKYLATYIDTEIYKNEELPVRESVKKACDEINTVFSELNVDAKIIGLKKDGSKTPLFRNSAGKTFDITYLSSGEKQLFVRIMALKMIKANNSVILVDEPEISLHPVWQQRILRVYENIGENNQVIAATHSPHVLSSARKESVRLLINDEGKIRVMNYEEIDGSYGLPVNRVLVELMGVDTIRNPEVDERFKVIRNMIRNGEYETNEFQIKYKELKDIVGTPDEDIVLIQMELDRLKRKRQAESC